MATFPFQGGGESLINDKGFPYVLYSEDSECVWRQLRLVLRMSKCRGKENPGGG